MRQKRDRGDMVDEIAFKELGQKAEHLWNDIIKYDKDASIQTTEPFISVYAWR